MNDGMFDNMTYCTVEGNDFNTKFTLDDALEAMKQGMAIRDKYEQQREGMFEGYRAQGYVIFATPLYSGETWLVDDRMLSALQEHVGKNEHAPLPSDPACGCSDDKG